MQDEDILKQSMDMLDGNVLAGCEGTKKDIADYMQHTDPKKVLDAYYTAICAQLWLTMKDDPNIYGQDGAQRILGFKRVFNAGAVYGPQIKQHLKSLGLQDESDAPTRHEAHQEADTPGKQAQDHPKTDDQQPQSPKQQEDTSPSPPDNHDTSTQDDNPQDQAQTQPPQPAQA